MTLSSAVWAASFFFGSLLGWGGVRYPRVVGLPTRVAASFLAGVPAIVFLFWLHYPAQSLIGVIIEPFYTAIVALSILGTFMVADTTRSVLGGFPKQYAMAARVCGLSERTIFTTIQLPLIFRQILPAYLIIAVNLLHMTLFASLIAVNEIFRVTQRINSLIYKPVELYTGLALFFALISVPLFLIAYSLQLRYTRDISER
jgi:ABC-type amino acid transport system permease subunit